MNYKIVIATLIMFLSTYGVVTYASSPGDLLYPVVEEVNTSTPDWFVIGSARSTSEVAADQFADYLNEHLTDLADGYTKNTMYYMRVRAGLAKHFAGAFGSIEAAEDLGASESTKHARKTMQLAVEQYMQGEERSSDVIHADISRYSKVLTESLIAVATE